MGRLLIFFSVLLSAQDTLERRANQRNTNFYVGAAIHTKWAAGASQSPITTNASYAAIASREYSRSMVVVTTYWSETEASEGVFDFTSSDEVADWALAHGMKAKGHVMLHSNECCLPAWVSAKGTSAALQSAVVNHVSTVVSHFEAKYPGLIKWWDIGNEFLRNDEPAPGTFWWAGSNVFTDSPGLPTSGLGVDTVPLGLEAAYAAARAACLSCKLGYNDFWIELTAVGKFHNTLNLMRSFQRDASPIDYIGLQAHLLYDTSYTTSLVDGHRIINELEANLNSIGALGLKAHISELDVALPASPTAGQLAQQATVFGDVARTCYYNPNCEALIVWGIFDGLTWLTGQHPLLFDGTYNPKASYTEMLTAMPAPRLYPLPGPVSK